MAVMLLLSMLGINEMATITVKHIMHGMFDSVAKAALDYYNSGNVSHVSFDFNSRVYIIGPNTTMESLYLDLVNGDKK